MGSPAQPLTSLCSVPSETGRCCRELPESPPLAGQHQGETHLLKVPGSLQCMVKSPLSGHAAPIGLLQESTPNLETLGPERPHQTSVQRDTRRDTGRRELSPPRGPGGTHHKSLWLLPRAEAMREGEGSPAGQISSWMGLALSRAGYTCLFAVWTVPDWGRVLVSSTAT